jgi:alpha-tubulin suppressor-like RCC1 family protein
MEIVSNFRRCIFSGTSSPPVIAMVACGEDFSIALDTDGYMYSTGSSEYGQLGNGATGEYFIAANKLGFANAQSFQRRTTFCHAPNEKIYGNSDTNTKVIPIANEDIRIQQVVCGKHHCIALEANTIVSDDTTTSNPSHEPPQPRIFTWGCGDYGVLGHGIQADEYYPRHVGAFNHLRYRTTVTSVSEIRIAAGQHCSILQTSNGHVYYWGKHRTVGEATMRPTLVDALANNGHIVSHIGAGGQTVVCCTQHGQTVGWGQGMYGELGFGSEKKSSSKPSFVPGLDGCHITSLACGYGTTLFVVRDSCTKDQTLIEALPKLDAEVLHELAEMYPSAGTMEEEDYDDDNNKEDGTKSTKGRKGKAKK